MQIYPIAPGFTAGESFQLAIQPGSCFSLAIYVQGIDEALKSVAGVAVLRGGPVKAEMKNGKYVFQSPARFGAMQCDKDWDWPVVTIKPNAPALESGAYAVIAYEVGPNGEPVLGLCRYESAQRSDIRREGPTRRL